MSREKTITVHCFSDPGHGWGRVPLSTLLLLGIADKITRYSYVRGERAYLEEDCDMSTLANAAEAQGYTLKVIGKPSANKSSPIRNFACYTPEHATRQRPAPGLIAELGNVRYTLKRSLGSKGWEVEANGMAYRMPNSYIDRATISA